MKVWKEAIQQARTAGKGKEIGPLLQIADDKALNLTLTSQVILKDEEEQFYKDIRRPEKAATSHSQAEWFKQEIEYLIEKAKALQSQGDEQRQLGDLDAALESYKEALKLFQKVGNYPEDEVRLQEAIYEIEHPPGLNPLLPRSRNTSMRTRYHPRKCRRAMNRVRTALKKMNILERKPKSCKSKGMKLFFFLRLPGSTKEKAATNPGIFRVPITLIRKRPFLATGISLLIIALVCVLILVSILHGGTTEPFPVQLGDQAVGITQLSNGELIGMSNGSIRFRR